MGSPTPPRRVPRTGALPFRGAWDNVFAPENAMNENFTASDFAAFCAAHRPSYQQAYYAMYSSWWDGITTDPGLMVIPIDDHMVHRGDGLFETFKCVGGCAYNLSAHWERLERGADRIQLPLPWDRAGRNRILAAVLRAGRHRDALIRVFVSRGPGGHSANPLECPEPLLAVLAIRLGLPFMVAHPGGARVGLSDIPVKPDFFARVKSVNYLPNALMRRQAVERGLDFVLSLDPDGCVAELPTENFGIVTPDRRLLIPLPDHILAGTTMHRAALLARTFLVPEGILSGVEEAPIPLDLARRAPEMFVFGTTPDVTAVTEFDGRPVGDGRPGPVFDALSRVFAADLRHPAMLTRLWP